MEKWITTWKRKGIIFFLLINSKFAFINFLYFVVRKLKIMEAFTKDIGGMIKSLEKAELSILMEIVMKEIGMITKLMDMGF